MFIKIFLVLDSGMENVIVTQSISGGLIYGDGHRRKARQITKKTDVLEYLYFVCQDVCHGNIQTAFIVPLLYGSAVSFRQM